MFSDESRFCLRKVDGRLRVWRRPGERFADVCVQEVTAFGGGSVMIWAGITATQQTPAVIIPGNLNSRRYIAEIVTPHVIPMSQQYGNAFIFQYENARPHRARIVDDHMAHHGINRMEWPAASPDLNPIENLWEKLGRDMRTAVGPDTTLLQLQPILVNAWNNIPQAYITNLINSMRRRCQQCIASRGSYTSY